MSKLLHISISGLLDLLTLNVCHMCALLGNNCHWVWSRTVKVPHLWRIYRWYVTSCCDLDLWSFDFELL